MLAITLFYCTCTFLNQDDGNTMLSLRWLERINRLEEPDAEKESPETISKVDNRRNSDLSLDAQD